MALLDTRDAALCVWHDDTVVSSPGFVLLDGSTYHFGDAALAQSKLRPRDINNRFWWQLGTQPLNPALGTARHTADLAHAHLQALHREAGGPSTMALAVPDSMPREQLSLLLGIVQACDFSAVGLVSRSVLLASGSGISERCLHVELQLHQGVINELAPMDGKLALQRSTPLPACGLLALQERCVSAIAGSFIQQTRFDPRRRAESEQALYNQLPEILQTLAERGECSVDIDGHRCRVVAASLTAVTERLIEALQQVLAGKTLPVLLDRQLQLLAGIAALPGDKLLLADDALWRAYQQHEQNIHSEGNGLHLVDRLPLNAAVSARATPASHTSATPGTPAPAAEKRSEATHVLLGVRARALKGDRVDLADQYFLQRSGAHWTLHGKDALINGVPSNPKQALMLGDTLSLGAAGHGRLIEIVD